MSKPTLVLVPGSFALPSFYDTVTAAIRAEGYTIQTLHLPSAGPSAGKNREGDPPTMYDDAAFIADAVSKYLDEGKDVVVYAHSYGGVPTTQCLKGLTKSERQKEGKTGGVVRVAYMTCIVPALGGNSVLSEVAEEDRLAPGQGLEIDEKGWMLHNDPARSARICFGDLTPEQGETWIKRFPQHSSASFAGELTHVGYKDVPVSWLLCENDLCIPPSLQKSSIDRIENESGNKVDVTSIEADHIPIAVENPKVGEAIDWFLKVAAKESK